ncbi:arylamine N-acetyltransferase family protein [Chengkuizengella sediminis]|uniref:arylamine N-acetyltransferase family protein n=1 Tax=Chengkuizengella sediminis TaxID=1885917 RepID=UPI00138A3C50|nr:arylamine N-acetyltransferase [Chengkuizengella sediminis]NDI34912.1 arylamine N-acetyltransferase [Chengkuizengella sediminis]
MTTNKDMNVNEYLKRIKVQSKTGDVIEDLKLLQTQNLYHVPFENLDVINKVSIQLDLPQIYHKIVQNHRGGFCYELNGIFHWLLKQLGYEVKMISSTIAREKNLWYMENTHLANIVTMNGVEYLIDVGTGYTARSPIPLTGEIIEDIGGKYRIYPVEESLHLQQLIHDEWAAVYRFTTTPRTFSFFEEVCRWNQTSPESPFTQKKVVTKATETGRITLTNHEIITTINGEKSKKEYQQHELPDLLDNLFGMDMYQKQSK